MAKKMPSTKGRQRNDRVGCIGGDYMMPISFRTNKITTSVLRQIQVSYRTGYFTQKELARYFNLSYGLVGKACRIARENGGEKIIATR